MFYVVILGGFSAAGAAEREVTVGILDIANILGIHSFRAFNKFYDFSTIPGSDFSRCFTKDYLFSLARSSRDFGR